MKKNFFALSKLSIITVTLSALIFSTNVALAQQAPVLVINYDFGDKEASFNPNPGASSTSFLPKVTASKGVKVRVRTASDGTGAINLVKSGAGFIKGAGLEVIAGTTTSKFSIYNLAIEGLVKTSFNIKIDAAAAGQWVFANGASDNSDDLFQGNSGIKETSTEVFAGLRWNLSAAEQINFYSRNGAKWAAVKGVSFVKNTDYLIEVYSNNGAEAKKYTKEGEQTLNVGTYHVWVNGKRVAGEFVSGGLEVGKSLNGFIIYGVTPKGNDTMAKAWLDNLEINGNL
ncbi:hypothetical protein [Pedobacter xixiisoli]|uniref:Uncharacterized protein n=1 Tax=Pedobacter xixiisoli TaxID=1476464 RepID=A0A285ZZ42_9SPHI|nr:hypothetical protein [Pedobacter xixiisoli]SOD14912.1 hypothetical protein SAMN06297358_1876 [Pedobacter xixiisoli]